MKWLIVLLILSGCTPRLWTKQEKILLVASCLASATDTYTTIEFLGNDDNWEVNPILGKHPQSNVVISYMILSEFIIVMVAHYIPKYRSWILGAKTSINTLGTVNNLTLDW